MSRHKAVAALLGERLDGNRFAVRLGDRGALKQVLLGLGWPVADEAGFDEGDALTGVELTADLRSYQGEALAAWWQDGDPGGGRGVLTLPCGAGKTVIALGALATAATRTLVVCTSISAARQWVREFGDPRGRDIGMVDWIEMIPFNETRTYVQRVLENLQIYRGQDGNNTAAFSLAGDLAR